jgi:hypothetical protein
MRDEVLTSLVEQALTDGEFRQAARADLEPTLARYGYELTGEELDAVRLMQAQTADLSDEQVTQQLEAMARDGVTGDVVAHG